jgi:hypothetical protein
MFTVGVIFLLMGLLIVGLRIASRTANKAAETHAVAALTMGCEQFKNDFGFPPPLVMDFDPGASADTSAFVTGADQREGPLSPIHDNPQDKTYDPVAFLSTSDHSAGGRFEREERYLRGRKPTAEGTRLENDYRFSTYSLAYYLLGALGKDPTGALIDGVEGAGFLRPNADGTFRKTGGKKYEPLFDTKGTKGVVAVDTAAGRLPLCDRRGVPYRYYMWRHGRVDPQKGVVVEKPDDLNIPLLLGDPATNTSLRNAEYAIVGAGVNGVFGDWWDATHFTETPDEIKQGLGRSLSMNDERAAAMAREDNVVGVQP